MPYTILTSHTTRLYLILGLTLAVACSSKDSGQEIKSMKVPDAVVHEPAPSCEGLTRHACFEKRRAMCDDSTVTWRVSIAMGRQDASYLYLSTAGILRFDYRGKRMYGAGGNVWLSCTEQCPHSEIGSICVPSVYVTGVSASLGDQDCGMEIVDDAAWHGRASKRARVTCSGLRMEVRYVPDLVRLRDAMVAVEMIAADDLLARVDGLPISLKIGNNEFFRLDEPTAADCSAFTYPDYTIHDSPEDFAALETVYPPLEQNFQQMISSLTKQRQERAREKATQQTMKELARQCFGDDRNYDESALDECLQSRPDLQETVARMMNAYTSELFKEIVADMEPLLEIMEREVEKPLCEYYARQHE